MRPEEVHAELGEIVVGIKPGREGEEMIVVDLTGVGIQDTTIAEVAWSRFKVRRQEAVRATSTPDVNTCARVWSQLWRYAQMEGIWRVNSHLGSASSLFNAESAEARCP